MRILRGIKVPDGFINVAISQLTLRNYTPNDARTAENWLLMGNWQYKKAHILELSDFFPTKEQLQSTGKRFVPLEIAKEREKQLMHTIARLNEEKQRIEQMHAKNDDDATLDDDYKCLLDMINNLMSKNHEYHAFCEEILYHLQKNDLITTYGTQQFREKLQKINAGIPESQLPNFTH